MISKNPIINFQWYSKTNIRQNSKSNLLNSKTRVEEPKHKVNIAKETAHNNTI